MVALLAAHALAAPADPALRPELERIAAERVFFGHQSVGNNVIQGLRELADSARVPLRIAEIKGGAPMAAHTFSHAFVADNGDPHRKLRSFEQALESQDPAHFPDIAMLKFCYVDIGPDTDVKTLFAAYRETIERLSARHPKTVFVHATVPLTDVQTGGKALAKRLLGRAPWGTVENVRRQQYNALVRAAYEGREPLFDIARIESTAPDGRVATVKWEGSVVPAMAGANTDDGGHLNAGGRLRAARELITVIARAKL